MEIRQTYDIPKIVGMFEKSWGQQFDPNSRESCGCLFEECVFGHHINPQHAMAVVEEAKHLVFTTVFDANGNILEREISYPGEKVSDKPSGLHIGPRPGHYTLACD